MRAYHTIEEDKKDKKKPQFFSHPTLAACVQESDDFRVENVPKTPIGSTKLAVACRQVHLNRAWPGAEMILQFPAYRCISDLSSLESSDPH